jgi:type 1 glutamine amidotransferase
MDPRTDASGRAEPRGGEAGSGSVDEEPPSRIDVVLVCGGRYHDFDFARLRLLGLLAENERHRVHVASDFRDTELIDASDFLVTYTCDVRPTETEQRCVADWLRRGGRWFALHGTNATFEFAPAEVGGTFISDAISTPRVFPLWAKMLGSQFLAHPPIQPYRVEAADPAHPLVAGIEPFDASDELYLSEFHDREELVPLLQTRWSGTAEPFVEAAWLDDEPRLVAYLRRFGAGAVFYFTLGHCRGHYDMEPQMAYYPKVQRGSWEVPQMTEMLRRGLAWASSVESASTA